MTASTKTVGDVLKAAADYLAAQNVHEPRLAAEHLAARLLNCKRLELHVRTSDLLSEKQLEAMRRGTKRLAAGEPVQYVIGQWDFMGRTFKVDRRALIPRPETESLVEDILECKELWDRPKPAILDIGTGTGCIIISLALARPGGLFLAIDVSDEALELSRENAETFGLSEKVAFANSELCDLVEPASLDAIVANLPYIPTADWEKLPVHIRQHEPRLALDGGDSGLAVMENVVQDAAMALKNGGFLFLEIGFNQAPEVKALLGNAGFDPVHVKRDLAGKDRIVVGRLS